MDEFCQAPHVVSDILRLDSTTRLVNERRKTMASKERLRLVAVPKPERDLRKLARVLLVLVGELPAADVPSTSEGDDSEAA
jgi:hypothetical protein